MIHDQVTFLQRLIEDASPGKPLERRESKCARYFLDAHSMGALVRSTITYSPDDIAHAKDILCAHGMPQQAIKAGDRCAISAMPGITDKAAHVSPHAGEVAIKALTPGCRYNGLELSARLPGYLVAGKGQAVDIEADGVFVVENLETFKQIDRYRWIFDTEMARLRILMIFRGDHRTTNSAVQAVLNARTEPVWSFPDLDPAGLGLASQLPRLAGLVFPWGQIERLLRERRMSSLFDDQIKQWGPTLRACTHPDVQRAWHLIDRLGLGLNQEALRDIQANKMP